jgi:subtilase family serine protease
MRVARSVLSFSATLLALSTLSFAVQPDRITGPIDSGQMVSLKNHVYPMAQPQFDQGPMEASHSLNVTMLFTPSDVQRRALVKLLDDQQNPKSASYHKWLTPEQFGDRFGLSQADIGKVRTWLESRGFKILYVARGRDSISFTGSAGQVESTFKTDIRLYKVNGEAHFGNSTPPLIPASLSGIVGGFRGLHNFFRRPALRRHPDYTLTTTGGSFTFLAPGDIATIYDINPLYQSVPAIDGTGQKIVIVGQSDIYLADLNDFRSAFGLTTFTGCTTSSAGVITACNSSNFQFVIPGTGGDPGLSPGDLGESDLDIEWSGSVARKAKIIFVTSSGGVDDSASWAIDNQLAPVISMSYGLCEALNTAPSVTTQDLEFKKAAGLGISFFASSGDAGAATCDGIAGNSSAMLGLAVSYPASSPYVTAVGGTEFNEGSGTFWNATNGANGGSAISYIPELAWNDTTLSEQFGFGLDATGGGPSNCVNFSGTTTTNIQGQLVLIGICSPSPNGGFAKPSYQTALTPSDGVRDVPDVSFSASNANDPYIVCVPQSEVGGNSSASTCASGINTALSTFNSAFGGTSVSAPVMAGITVLLNQDLGGTGLGNINPQLYNLFGTTPGAFHDIVAGFNSVTLDTSDNIVPCTAGTPAFTNEPAAIQCPAGGTFGFAAGSGYDLATGLGSLDVSAFASAWFATLPNFTLAPSPSSLSAVAGHTSNSTTITITPQNGFNSAVAFTCSGLPTGATCNFNPVSGTTSSSLTIQTLPNMAAATTNVTVNGTSGSLKSTTTVSLAVTATDQSFTLGPANASITVAQGSPGSTNLTMTPVNGFSAALTYSCVMPSTLTEATCTTSVVDGTTEKVSVTTTLATGQLLRPPLIRSSRIWYAVLLPGLVGIFFTAGSKRTPRGLRLLSLIVVLGLSTLWMGACGGGSSNKPPPNPGTPKGNYTLTINATTGGASPVTGTTTVSLTVN